MGYESEDTEPSLITCSWLACIGLNSPQRAAAPEVGNPYHMPPAKRLTRPEDRITQFLDNGDTSLRTIPVAEDDHQLAELWLPFGWSNDPDSSEGDEIKAFREGVAAQKDIAPHERTLWYTGAYDGDLLVSAAMAERLVLPGRYGNVNFVELTEWSTRRDRNEDGISVYAGRGYLAASLALLTAQVVLDLRDHPIGLPIIYAECNTASEARYAARSVGVDMVDRAWAPQILRQSVHIDDEASVDGEVLEAGLRDFNYVRVEPSTILDHYNEETVNSMLDMAGQTA